MTLDYRIEAIEVWPGKRTDSWARQRSKFKTMWTKMMQELEREVRMLNGDNVVLRLEVSQRDIRLDGMLRADARPRDPGVVVQFRAKKLAGAPTLYYRCDTFTWWQDNLNAIVKGLEALRMVDRYGVTPTGEQYAGFKALPSSTAATLSTEAAAIVVGNYHSSHTPIDILQKVEVAREAVRSAVHRTHPDRNGGDRSAYDNVDAARQVLSGHHGVSL